MDYIILVIFCVLAYLIGTIPTGWVIVKKLTGLNLQEHGSGGLGAANVKRVLLEILDDKKIAKIGYFLTMLGDGLKGALIVFIAHLALKNPDHVPIVGLLVVIGNCYNVWFRFKKGGKGVATLLGVGIILSPIPTFTALIVWILVKKIWGYTSLAAISGVPCLALFSIIHKDMASVQIMLILITIIILVRHKDNIYRLRHGQEPKFDPD